METNKKQGKFVLESFVFLFFQVQMEISFFILFIANLLIEGGVDMMEVEQSAEEIPLQIAVIGMGYVGLSFATMLSRVYPVRVLDIDVQKVDSINQRQSPIEDRGIEEYFASKELNLFASLDPSQVLPNTDLVVIATPTNYDSEQNRFDTQSVESSIEAVLAVSPQAVIMIRSTVPVGFTETMEKRYPAAHLVFSPEFLRETKALEDNLHPSRIILGYNQSDTYIRQIIGRYLNMVRSLIDKSNTPVVHMSASEAEAVKLFSNTYLAMRISFFNELDTYADRHGLDSRSIIEGVGLDPRIGLFYNNPSFGYGGYCLPKDTKQLLAHFEEIPQNMMTAIVDANQTRMDYIACRAKELLKETGQSGPIGIYRLTMKSQSDNFRESSIQGIIQRLQADGVPMVLYEPLLEEEVWQGIPVIKGFEVFCQKSALILANRYVSDLDIVREKVYTKDLFERD